MVLSPTLSNKPQFPLSQSAGSGKHQRAAAAAAAAVAGGVSGSLSASVDSGYVGNTAANHYGANSYPVGAAGFKYENANGQVTFFIIRKLKYTHLKSRFQHVRQQNFIITATALYTQTYPTSSAAIATPNLPATVSPPLFETPSTRSKKNRRKKATPTKAA